ncbi:MAG: threonine dehydrogenase [Acidimicrobiales bacterium]|nr:threonine dehydrogenase [Acidimicrobiales bacterium]
MIPIRVAEPGPGQLRVAVEGCGVCGSSLPLWQGRPWFHYPRPPGAPGHEGWGTIEAVGDAVQEVRSGDRVAFLSDVAFADLVIVAAAEAAVLPGGLAGTDFPGEAFGSGWNVAARAGFAAGQTIAVVGIGFIGAIAVARAVAAGARVIAVSRRPFSLEVAQQMGAHELVHLGAMARTVDEVRRHTGGALCDVVVEAVGRQGALDLAGALTAVRGRLVIAGFHQDGPRSVDLQLWNWRGIDVVNAHERDPQVVLAGVRAAAEAVASGRLDPTPLLTHRYALDEVGRALDAMAERPPGFLKAVVRP